MCSGSAASPRRERDLSVTPRLRSSWRLIPKAGKRRCHLFNKYDDLTFIFFARADAHVPLIQTETLGSKVMGSEQTKQRSYSFLSEINRWRLIQTDFDSRQTPVDIFLCGRLSGAVSAW